MSLFDLYPQCSITQIRQCLPLYVESLAQSRDIIMADIAAKIAEIRALATEEAINDAVNKKVDAMRKIGDQEDNKIEGPCPFVDRFPVELRVKVYTALLRYKNPVRVIPRRKRFSSTNDLEAERLSWYAGRCCPLFSWQC